MTTDQKDELQWGAWIERAICKGVCAIAAILLVGSMAKAATMSNQTIERASIAVNTPTQERPMDKLISFLSLSFARGYRTYLCISTIGILALLQKHAGLRIPDDVWGALFLLLAACLRAALGTPPTAAALLCLLLFSSAASASEASPSLYITQSAALEAHHGTTLASTSVGSITRIGADYGPWAIESVIELPLYREQQHTRRAIGADLLLKPWRSNGVEPFLCAGAGYYWGSDPYQCAALDVGAGVRFHVSDYCFLQLDARDAIPLSGHDLLVHSRFQLVSIGLGFHF